MSETPTPPPVPAGWYPDTTNPTVQRYWDGATWTDHTAPAGTVSNPAKMATKTKLLIAGGVIAGLIVVSSIAATAANRPTSLTPADLQTQEAIAPEPSATPSPEPTIEAPEIDVAAFQASASGDLADFEKDLNDMVITVGEGGFWRLLSNSIELSFNLGQLEAMEAPPSVSSNWATGLAALDASITVIDDAIGTDDAATILAAIESSRAQVNSLRAILAVAT
jgi:hypothetical protein